MCPSRSRPRIRRDACSRGASSCSARRSTGGSSSRTVTRDVGPPGSGRGSGIFGCPSPRPVCDNRAPENPHMKNGNKKKTSDPFDPTRADRFSFGLWTVGNPGRDPFGEPVRARMEPTYIVKKLAECGAHGVNLHDNDLLPLGSSAGERDRIVGEFKAALEDNGMVVPMATTNLFSHPVFKDGAFSANDTKVRAFALRE